MSLIGMRMEELVSGKRTWGMGACPCTMLVRAMLATSRLSLSTDNGLLVLADTADAIRSATTLEHVSSVADRKDAVEIWIDSLPSICTALLLRNVEQ
eukprot:CAMPEP_0202868138 /NCGR_PEP_ID=MMETSP1391-20130828/10274_1 /ASSEMBLY_ACC=CAM_ASM_000867 /TAXON_ID=1034604 /ORGANISM="Chlamydomonas leiostraca, Strain SAG 11-49" /LENGTH=96 /DNA_ID=CAMNT_0049548259 /DNA_START=646 /DNA_END=936 /DNA_ORIENTATION=-